VTISSNFVRIFLGIIDERSAQEVANPLGGELRVALVDGQLPPRAAAEEQGSGKFLDNCFLDLTSRRKKNFGQINVKKKRTKERYIYPFVRFPRMSF
jgi:hypothetical protein